MEEKHSEAPQTDDLAAIEQWHENQEAQAGEHPIEPIAVSDPVGIKCVHGYDTCPDCDGEVRR